MSYPSAAKLRSVIAGALLVGGGALAAAPTAQASHLQGGSFKAAITADGRLTGTLTYLERIACASGLGTTRAIPGVSVTNPNGETVQLNVSGSATACRPSEAVYEASLDLTLGALGFTTGAPDGIWRISYRNGNRVGGIVNFANSNSGYVALVAQIRKVTGQATSAPVLGSNAATGISVVRQDPVSLNAVDPDGGTLTYRTALKVPPAGSTSFADPDAADSDVVAIDADGVLTIPTASSMTPGAFYTYKTRVTDSQGDFTDRDVLMTVAPAGQAPPNVDGLASSYTVQPGQTRTITFSAGDTSPSPNNVTVSPAGLPSWATLTQTTGNPASATLTLAPPAGLADTVAAVNLDATTVGQPPLTTTRTVRVTVQTPAAAPAAPAAPAPAPAATPTARPTGAPATLAPGARTTLTVDADARRPAIALPIACPSGVACTVTGTLSTTKGEVLGRPRTPSSRRNRFGRFTGLRVRADGRRTVKVVLDRRFVRSARRHGRTSVKARLTLTTRLADGSVRTTRRTLTIRFR
jgi:hypothetical protein